MAQKSLPLTKEEVMQLVDLVHANPVLFSKATNASNNQLKEATWFKVTNTFNSLIKSCPRKPEQLRLKWENLKKSARKRSTKLRMNNLKTGGGKPEYIPPDEALEKVAAILGPTCDGYTVHFGGDAEEPAVLAVTDHVMSGNPVVENPMVEELVEDFGGGNVVLELEDAISPLPSKTLCTPVTSKKFFFSSASGRGKIRRDDEKAARIARNRAIAEYYISKKEIHDLKKRKLELEIALLQNKFEKKEDN